MSEANKELVRRHFDEIWNQRNLMACDELMAEDFVENAAAPFAPTALAASTDRQPCAERWRG